MISSLLLGSSFHKQLHQHIITFSQVYASFPCYVQKFTVILTYYRDVLRLFLRGESSTYLLEPALASLCLVLEHLRKVRLLSPQDF